MSIKRKNILTEVGVVASSIMVGLFATVFSQYVQNFFQLSTVIGTVASAISAGIISYILARKTLSKLEIDALVIYRVMFASLGTFIFLFSVPTTVDRSFSVWTINSIYKATSLEGSKELEISQLQKSMSDFFSYDSGETTRRIREQIIVGNLEQEGKYIRLTDQGKVSRTLFYWTSVLFNLNPKYAR